MAALASQYIEIRDPGDGFLDSVVWTIQLPLFSAIWSTLASAVAGPKHAQAQDHQLLVQLTVTLAQ